MAPLSHTIVKKDLRSQLVDAVMGLARMLGGDTGKKLFEASRQYVQRRKDIFVKYHKEEIAAAKKFREHVEKVRANAALEKADHAHALSKVEDMFKSL